LTNHDDLLDWCRRGLNMDDQGCLDWRQDDGMASPVSQLCPAGERRFEVRSTRNGQGGQVFSFTDVTDMLTAQAALRETAETLERRVSERTAELMSVNERLGQEVAERRTIEAALIQAKIAAEKANLSKTSFLAAASHDLLQPLNAACLFVAAGRPAFGAAHAGAGVADGHGAGLGGGSARGAARDLAAGCRRDPA
jgi:hypothetical protein